VVIDQVFLSAITEERTVQAIFQDVKLVLEVLRKKGYDKPALMQFDAIDPQTGHVVSIVTNARVKETKVNDVTSFEF